MQLRFFQRAEILIVIPRIIYEKFLRFALENANPFGTPNTWKECIGLILGRINKNEILVTDIIPIKSGTGIHVDIIDYEKVFSLISTDRIDSGEVIVGWAHTHPGLGLFFSSTDIQTQKWYQRMHPLSFGLVLDPVRISQRFAGLNIYRVNEQENRAVPATFSLEDSDFLQIKNSLVSELYVTPPLIEAPTRISDSTVSWNNIKISIRESIKEIKLNEEFLVILSIQLPYRQYIRVSYQTQIDDCLTTSSRSEKRLFYHETISSGSLAIFSYRTQRTGITVITIYNLKLINYKQQEQEMPDLSLRLDIRDSI